MKEIKITGEYIQLDQFLKKENFIASGGETLSFLQNHLIDLNGKKVTEKRKKIRHCDELVIDGDKFKFIGVSQ